MGFLSGCDRARPRSNTAYRRASRSSQRSTCMVRFWTVAVVVGSSIKQFYCWRVFIVGVSPRSSSTSHRTSRRTRPALVWWWGGRGGVGVGLVGWVPVGGVVVGGAVGVGVGDGDAGQRALRASQCGSARSSWSPRLRSLVSIASQAP